MARVYDLQLEEMKNEHGHIDAVYSKGHHDLAAFIPKAEGFANIRFSTTDPATARQAYARWIPMDGEHFYYEYATGGHGAFPITIINITETKD